MSLNILMIIVTLTAGGQHSAAFVNTASLEECEQRARAVRAILEAAGTPLIQIVCLSSEAHFSPFSHEQSPDTARTRYIIELSPERAIVTKLLPGQACAVPSEASPAAFTRYCATSTQTPLATQP